MFAKLWTSRFNSETLFSLFLFFKTSEIKWPTMFNSFSFIPHVVAGGVPIRIPDVINGERGSKGIAFRFNVIPTSFSNMPASFPVRSSSTLLVSTSTR